MSPALALLCCLLLLVGCGGSGSASKAKIRPVTEGGDPATEPENNEGGESDPESSAPVAGPTDDFMTITDPVNAAFTVDVPVGWDNLAYSVVDGQYSVSVVNSVSPDGGTVLFAGDPRLPSYWVPSLTDEITRTLINSVESMQLADYQPAPQYLQDYIGKKFGSLTGFEIVDVEPWSEMEQQLWDGLAAAGVRADNVDAARVRFRFTDDKGNSNEAFLAGVTMRTMAAWQVQLAGLATTGSSGDYEPMMLRMFNSIKITPEFKASQQARHEQAMASIQANTEAMRRRHEGNMAAIQASAQAHQQRMQSIWAANDASVASYYDRMKSSDVQHRAFLNAINDESTVSISGGQKLQVDNSYQRYWVNKSDGTYVGGDINFGDSQLRALGLNPSDYEEATVVRG